MSSNNWHVAAEELHKRGVSWRQISSILNIPKSTVSDYLRVHTTLQPLADGAGRPNVLAFDIESAPNAGYIWRCFKENIAPIQMLQYSTVLCWAAKWLGEDDLIVETVQNDDNDWRCNDLLWDLFDKADVVIAHNAKQFDCKTMNTRWLDSGKNPPSPYKIIDTLTIARKNFRFPSNSLDGIARYLGIGHKLPHTGFQLWIDCMAGDPDAWKTMVEYNIRDTYILEEVYLRLRAWDKQHPNLALYYSDNKTRCPLCGSENLLDTDKVATTAVSLFPVYVCGDCGRIMRSGKRLKIDKEIYRNVA